VRFRTLGPIYSTCPFVSLSGVSFLLFFVFFFSELGRRGPVGGFAPFCFFYRPPRRVVYFYCNFWPPFYCVLVRFLFFDGHHIPSPIEFHVSHRGFPHPPTKKNRPQTLSPRPPPRFVFPPPPVIPPPSLPEPHLIPHPLFGIFPPTLFLLRTKGVVVAHSVVSHFGRLGFFGVFFHFLFFFPRPIFSCMFYFVFFPNASPYPNGNSPPPCWGRRGSPVVPDPHYFFLSYPCPLPPPCNSPLPLFFVPCVYRFLSTSPAVGVFDFYCPLRDKTFSLYFPELECYITSSSSGVPSIWGPLDWSVPPPPFKPPPLQNSIPQAILTTPNRVSRCVVFRLPLSQSSIMFRVVKSLHYCFIVVFVLCFVCQQPLGFVFSFWCS